MRIRSACRGCLFASLVFLIGCTSLPTEITVRSAAPCPCENPPALALVADGAGNFRATSSSLATVVAQTQTPLCVQSFNWSHGYGRILADQIGHEHIRNQGRRLAEEVLAYKRQHPDTPIYLVAHSAGTGVVLAAAEQLPSDTLGRVILLAPAVSTNRDLRPALVAARQGVDVFYSESDWWYLGMGITLLGTVDRHWDAAAGRVGFRPTVGCPEDGRLYDKLRQYPWEECLSWTGNKGGHYGAYQPGFLKVCVLPLLTASRERKRPEFSSTPPVAYAPGSPSVPQRVDK